MTTEITASPTPTEEIDMAKPPGPKEQQLRALRSNNPRPRSERKAAAKAAIEPAASDPAAPPKPRRKKKAGKKKAGKSGSKTDAVAALLRRKSGCTGTEILRATGWPTVSVPAMAKAAGLRLRMVKEPGKVTRYFGE